MPDEPVVVNFRWRVNDGWPMRGYAVGASTKFTFSLIAPSGHLRLGAANHSFPSVDVSYARTRGLRLTQGVAA